MGKPAEENRTEVGGSARTRFYVRSTGYKTRNGEQNKS
jgi:hypothetical protein